jgi:acyl dehydratase
MGWGSHGWEAPSNGARASLTRTFSAEDVELFARISGDRNPLHFDEAFANGTRLGRLVVQGGLTTGLFNALVAMQLPGPGSVFLHQEWDYPAPVFIGDTVTAEVEVVEARVDKPITRLRCVARRQDDAEVLRGECLVYTFAPAESRPPTEAPAAS